MLLNAIAFLAFTISVPAFAEPSGILTKTYNHLGLEKCKMVESNLQDRVNTFNRLYTPRLFVKAQVNRRTGFYSPSSCGLGCLSSADYYDECIVQISVSNSSYQWLELSGNKIYGNDRLEKCEIEAANFKTNPNVLLIEIQKGGAFKKWCTVVGSQLTF